MTLDYKAWLIFLIAACLSSTSASSQTIRRSASIEALEQHLVFFHREEVVVVTDVIAEGVLTWLVNHDNTSRILALDIPPLPSGTRERLEIIGTFYDVGRLDEDDPRLSNLPITQISQELFRKRWPGIGELPIVVANSTKPALEPDTATLRNIVLEPQRYLNKGVTVTGRFRGRNLYGDMPEAPETSRWDFVLHSVDASVWVVGKEPKGDGFELDNMARVDTSKWLEVTGEVVLEDEMVLIKAGTLNLSRASTDRVVATTRSDAPTLPPPEVIFSAPLADDIDVPTDSTVRIQFSRDMDDTSFDEHVTVEYSGPTSQTLNTDATISFELSYRRRNRVLEIIFNQELERYQNVHVELTDGISASDGSPLSQWELSFFVGGQ
tara:strand:- start:709 stop:1848 length:1140 start_codon:yes stop_codon:yes gene_type:complete